MKKITYNSAELNVPDWANWIAQDKSGSIYAYECEPIFSVQDDCWDINCNCEKYYLISAGWRSFPVDKWMETKKKI